MARNLVWLGLSVLALAMAPAAHAGDSEDFAGCDGLKKPKGKDDGMRGAASIGGYSYSQFFGAPQSQPMAKVQSCNRALSNPKLLPTQTLRKAHLLRARAAAYLELDKPQDALIDLDAADAAVAGIAQDVFFKRSMGASLMLMRAVAKAGLGEKEEAARLAEEAGALRPYAVQVQMAAAVVRDATRSFGVAGPSPWGNLTMLEPGSAPNLISREVNQGNFAGAVELARQAPLVWPADGKLQTLVVYGGGDGNLFTVANAAADLAYARAATGDIAGARKDMEDFKAHLSALDTETGPDAKPSAFHNVISQTVEPRLQLVEARIAIAEGRLEEARTLTTGKPFTLNAAVIDMFEALNKASGKPAEMKDRASLLSMLEEGRRKGLGGVGNTLLIAPESARNLIDYEKSRPNILGELVGAAFSMGTTLLDGIDRTAGFKSTPNTDGSVKVEYTGSTNSGPMVQEMTLLRAAEMAREAKKPRFAILDRKDYTQYMVTTQYGVETSRVPTGYKTELTVRFLDEGEQGPPAFTTVEIIDALGPLYYESKAATRTAVR